MTQLGDHTGGAFLDRLLAEKRPGIRNMRFAYGAMTAATAESRQTRTGANPSDQSGPGRYGSDL